jgi:integrase
MGTKATAKRKLDLTKRHIDALEPHDRPYKVWDSKLPGFGLRVRPARPGEPPTISFIFSYRPGSATRGVRSTEKVIGRYGVMTPAQARREAEKMKGELRAGIAPNDSKRRDQAMPTLSEAFEDYISRRPHLRPRTVEAYRYDFNRYLKPLHNKLLSDIDHLRIDDTFQQITRDHGRSGAAANRVISLVGSIYKPACVRETTLRNPVELWKAAGGRMNTKTRRKIDPPAEVLPAWRKGIEATVVNPVIRDALYWALFTGTRKGEILNLHWDNIDQQRGSFRVEAKGGDLLELPLTRQLQEILACRAQQQIEGWVFPSPASPDGRLTDFHHLYAAISAAGGVKFWLHAARNCYLTVGMRDLMLPDALCKRLVGHAPPHDVTEGYAAEWSIGQLREHAQRIADHIGSYLRA